MGCVVGNLFFAFGGGVKDLRVRLAVDFLDTIYEKHMGAFVRCACMICV